MIQYKFNNPVPKGTRISQTYKTNNVIDYNGDGIPDPHFAIDFVVPEGTRITSPFDAKVVEVVQHKGAGKNRNGNQYGTYVIVQRTKNTDRYWFAHLSYGKVFVNIGDTIKRGDLIGLSGNTGLTTGPHLHFECRKYPYNWGTTDTPGDRIDPMPALRTRWEQAQQAIKVAPKATAQATKSKAGGSLVGLAGLLGGHFAIDGFSLEGIFESVAQYIGDNPEVAFVGGALAIATLAFAYKFNDNVKNIVDHQWDRVEEKLLE